MKRSLTTLLAGLLANSCEAFAIPPPIVASVGASALALLGIRRANNEREAFYSMDWRDVDLDEGAEACIILGEETAENGKTWFVCSEPSQDAGMDCSPVEGYGNIDGGEWLCKQDKPTQSKKKFWQR